MRLHPKMPRPALALALAAALVAPAASRAQTERASTTKAPAGPPIPLAHFVPGGDIVVYLEFEGLDAHADAWQKTALYQVLNTTTAGPMLEDVADQVIDQTYTKLGTRWASGKEVVALMEHVAKNGVVFAGGRKGDDPKSAFTVLVLRGVFKNKDLKPVIGRMLGNLYDSKAKPKPVDVAGHKIIVAKTKGGGFFGYWVEDSRKEDLVIIPGAPNEAAIVDAATNVLATLDGTKPDAQNDETRKALAKEDEGFIPVGFGFVNALGMPPGTLPAGLQDVKGFDFRWGMQDKEIVSVLRVAAPKPREGMLAILDQPTFDKSGLPPIPEGVDGFTVVSMNLAKTLDQLVALAQMTKPDAGAQVEAFTQKFQEKTRLKLKEDVLAHLGPRIAVYNAPAKGSESKAARPGPLSALLGGKEIPRLTIVAEIDDAKAFGRTLDALMIAANQGLRSLAPMLSAVAPPPANDGGGPPGPGGPGGAQAKGARGPSMTLAFNQVGPGVYTMSPPPALAAMLPSYIRPTIRLGTKYLVISVSPEAARAATEVKGGGAAGSTFANALQSAPGGLIALSAADSADEIAAGLANYPARLQALADEAAAPASPLGLPAAGGPAPPPGAPRIGASSASGPVGMSGPGGAPAQPGGGQVSPEGGPLFTLRVDPAKLPSADAIKPLLVPGLSAVSVDDDGVEVVVRESFLGLPGLTDNSLASGSIQSILAQTTAKAKAASAANAPAAAPAAPGAAPAGPGGMPAGPPRRGRPGE